MPLRRVGLIVFVLAHSVLAPGCSRTWKSAAMAVEYEPPTELTFEAETLGTPKRAHFSPSLDVFSVDSAAVPQIDGQPLEQLLSHTLSLTGLPEAAHIVNAREGSIPAGAVARYELKSGEARTLIYYVPRSKRFLLWVLTARESSFGHLQRAMDLSMASVRFQD